MEPNTFHRCVVQGVSGSQTRGEGLSGGFVPHLNEACAGSISEVFDAEPPFTPRGCIAQAWSVAEVLRVWTELNRREAERDATKMTSTVQV